MKHRWIIILFAAAFVLSLGLGIGLRLAAGGENASEVTAPATQPEAVTEPSPDTPANTVSTSETAPEPVVTAPPETEAPEPSSAEPEPQPVADEPEPESGLVRICIGGDTSIDGEFADYASSHSVDYPWEDISELMNSADISIVNLETCVSERGVSEKREGYGFRTPPAMLEGFANAGIDAVNLANNHTRDFGYDALLDTFANLGDRGISYFGAGNDLEEAGGLLIYEINGVKVGFTGANRVSLNGDCAASDGHAGVNQIGGLDSESSRAYIERIKQFDSQCDVLIVFLHAGTEEVFDVTSYQKDMARSLIDAGADIVVGGHSHTLQPIEFYNEKLIIYSIGNLIFWHIDDDLDGLTAVFDLTVDKNGYVGLKLHPLFIKNYKVYYLVDGEGKYASRYSQIMELVNDLCEPYDIWFDSEGNMLRGIPEEILAEREAKRAEEAAELEAQNAAQPDQSEQQ